MVRGVIPPGTKLETSPETSARNVSENAMFQNVSRRKCLILLAMMVAKEGLEPPTPGL
jgi:hypothetical protein